MDRRYCGTTRPRGWDQSSFDRSGFHSLAHSRIEYDSSSDDPARHKAGFFLTEEEELIRCSGTVAARLRPSRLLPGSSTGDGPQMLALYLASSWQTPILPAPAPPRPYPPRARD